MKFVYLANILITALIGILLFVFKEFSSWVQVIYVVLLLLTLELPTIYLLLATRKKLDRNDNELLAPSLILSIFIFIVDLIFYSICVGISNDSIKLLVLFTVIFHIVMGSILLIIKAMTNYIRNQHNRR